MNTTHKSTYAAMFAKTLKQEQAKAKMSGESSGDSFKDPRFLDFQPNNSYTLRLLYWPNEKTGRAMAFIKQYKHTYYDKDNKKYYEVICPSSDYLDGNKKHCPICAQADKLYAIKAAAEKSGKPSPLAKELYDKFKRKAANYAVVYVVNDTSNPENNGTCKLMYYTYDLNRFIDMYVYGKGGYDKEGQPVKIADELVLGYDAFDLKNGRNLIIQTSPKRVGDKIYNAYSPQFSPKYTAVNLTDEELPQIFNDLNFDADFYRPVDKEAQAEFLSIMSKQDLLARDLSKGQVDEVDEDDSDIFEKDIQKDISEEPVVKTEVKSEEPKSSPKKEEAFEDFEETLPEPTGVSEEKSSSDDDWNFDDDDIFTK